MDRDQFDALTRMLATPETRRAALGTLLGVGTLGVSLETLARKAKKNRAQRKRRAKRRAKRSKHRAQAEASAGCCTSGNCTPGTGKNLTGCCFENQTLSGKNFKGSNLTRANFSHANLSNANFNSTNLTGACYVDADITGGKFKSANLSGVIRCRTSTADGEDNSGCDLGTPCCPTCDADHPCEGPGQLCCEGRCTVGECCGEGTQSTCGATEVCCDNQCVTGECCSAAECPPFIASLLGGRPLVIPYVCRSSRCCVAEGVQIGTVVDGSLPHSECCSGTATTIPSENLVHCN